MLYRCGLLLSKVLLGKSVSLRKTLSSLVETFAIGFIIKMSPLRDMARMFQIFVKWLWSSIGVLLFFLSLNSVLRQFIDDERICRLCL